MDIMIPALETAFFANRNCLFDLKTCALSIDSTSITYIIGHNGSGKSLFASSVVEAQQKRPQSVIKQGQAGHHVPAKIVLVHQNADENICVDLSVAENLLLRVVPKPTLKQLLTWWGASPIIKCHSPSLVARLHVDAGKLSAGERQVLSFECARMGRADLYIFDEFTAALDPAAKGNILPLLRNIDSGAVIVISHDIDEVQEFADRVIAFSRGRIIHDEPRPACGWNRGLLKDLASGAPRLPPDSPLIPH